MAKASRAANGPLSMESCLDLLKTLDRAAGPEDVREKLDLLIESIFLLKADLACPLDRQFFTDASKERKRNIAADGIVQSKSKALRHLCIDLVRAIAKMGRKMAFTNCIIPKVITIIRLESSLLSIANEDAECDAASHESFPVYVLELLLGIVLYAEEYDDGLVDYLIHDHLLSSEEWTYNSYIALEHMKKVFDSLQSCVYRDDKLSETEFLRRFIALLLRMPNPRVRERSSPTISMPGSKGESRDVAEDETDSDSSIEYSEEDDEEEEDETGDEESEVSNDQATNSYNYVKVYSALWYNTIFGRLPCPEELLCEVLIHMPKNVLPYSSNPGVYVNWLMKYLNGDDTILSMLSLKSVFELIAKYGLGEIEGIRVNNVEKQPISAFYERLYCHLNERIINSRYGKVFLELLNTALKSTMLPSQLVEKFIKGLVRMACLTRCMESTILLTIAMNLLKKHSQTCLGLVHAEDSLAEQIDESHLQRLLARDDVDDKRGGNRQMYLWEMTLLMNHFNGKTARVASTFYSDLRKRRCIMLNADDVIGCDAREHLHQELVRAKREDNIFRKSMQKTTTLTRGMFV